MNRIGNDSVRAAVLVAAALSALALVTSAAQAQATVEQRLQRVERVVDSGSLVKMIQTIDQLNREIRALRGEIELQGHAIERLRNQQREQFLDVDKRITMLETRGPGALIQGDIGAQPGGAESPANAGTPQGAAPSGTTNSAAATGNMEVDYQAAFDLLKSGNYAGASQSFTKFLKDYPDGPLTDNALYWLGESFYGTRELEPAMVEFKTLVSRYPDSSKYTHALLKIGYIHDELGNAAEARRVLTELSNEFPQSTAAGLARKRLENLNSG